MDEKDPTLDLSPEIACIHRKWNVRSVAYRSLITHFQKLDPSSDDWAPYRTVISNIAAESFPAIREQALEVVFHFVQNCGTAQQTSITVIHSLLDTIPINIKPRAKELLEQIILEYVEIGCSRDAVEELLRTALINQTANVATTCIEIITKILSVFGPTAIDIAYILETLPYLQESEELELRSATKTLILEVYRWQGRQSIKNIGQILNPVDLKDVMNKFEDEKQTAPLKPTRHVRSSKNITRSASRSDNPTSDQETDLLKQINDDFFRRLESSDWTERRNALKELQRKLESSLRLRPGNYEPLLTALKKVITEDQCVIVVGSAIASVTEIAKGLHQFGPYAVPICRILLEKFVEKRQNITEQLRKALDVITTTTSFESLIKTINIFLGSKNPTITFETIQLLSRMFKKASRQTLRKPEFSVLYKSLVDCLHHGQLIIREKSFIALAVAFKIAGEGVIMPYLENVDPITKTKFKNYNLNQDFEEKYNEVKYRNVGKKEFKNDDKLSVWKDNFSNSTLKENQIIKNENNKFASSVRGNRRTDNQNALVMNYYQKKAKPMRKRENQQTVNYNKVTKRWSSSNSNVTLERFYVKPESISHIKPNTVEITTLHKELRKIENIKKYPYRKPYSVQRKEINSLFGKDKEKKKKIFSYKKNESTGKVLEEVEENSYQIGDNMIANIPAFSNNLVNQQSEVTNIKPFQKFLDKKETLTISDQTVNCAYMTSPNNSELSQQMQKSVRTLDASKCGEGFIVLTENEVKKLLGLKRISTVSDDSCTILPDRTSKRNLFKRSYKIFQVSKDATERETQTSFAMESIYEISPEGGILDLTKAVDVIPTQTGGVNIEEKGTDARRVKRYNRGTQWVQHMQTEIPDKTTRSKQVASPDRKSNDQLKVHQSQRKKKEPPFEVQPAVIKEIEYMRPSLKDVQGKRKESEEHSPGKDHFNKQTMEINTYTATRADHVDMTNNSSESLTSELQTIAHERDKTKHHQGRIQNLEWKYRKTGKQSVSKSNINEGMDLKNSTSSTLTKKIKRKYSHEIAVRSNKETTESRQNDSQTFIRLKKMEGPKRRSQTKGTPRRNAMDFTSHKSELSIRSYHQKVRRSNFKKNKSKFKYDNSNDTSSGSCNEGCNFLPFVKKGIMGHQEDEKEKTNSDTRKNQRKHKSQWNAKRGNRSHKIETDRRKSDNVLSRRSPRRCYSGGDKGQQVMNAEDMDPETKQTVIKELLKACDISQTTFDKMVSRKVSPQRPCIFAPKAVLQRVNELSSADQDSEDQSAKDHKACIIM